MHVWTVNGNVTIWDSKSVKVDLGDSCITVFSSGWKRMYHLITEDPTEGDYHYEHEFVTRKYLEEREWGKVVLQIMDQVQVDLPEREIPEYRKLRQ